MEEHIDYLLNDIQIINESYDRVAEATGEYFNIFSVLKMETDEVKTHSKIIAELLDPKGSHRQGVVFLQLFLETLDVKDFELESVKVAKEKKCGNINNEEITGGRIDIIIENSEQAIVIENKIYATDQKNQLLRYYNNIESQKKKPLLVYLTLDGSEPNKQEVESLKNREIGIENLEETSFCSRGVVLLSYRDNIINWLSKCKKEVVDIPIIRESIQQYINLIKKITNQNINKKMSKDIINRIVKSKDSLTAYEKAYNSKNELFKQIVKGELEVLGRKNLFDFLEELAKNKELELNFKSIDKFIEGKKYVGFSFTNKKLIELNLKINFEFNASKHRDFFFGFWYIDRELVAQNIHPEIYKVIQEKFEDMFKGYNQPFTTKSTLCFKEYAEYKNWNKIGFTKEFLFGDFKEDIRNKVEKMIEIIL